MDESRVRKRYELIEWVLDERQRRLLAAAEAQVLGHGGITAVSNATGISRPSIHAGIKELSARTQQEDLPQGRVRRPGGGRKRATEKDASLREDLERLVDPVSRGDPESPLRWTIKSLRTLAGELNHQGHHVSHVLVGQLLEELGYSLQGNRKTLEGGEHPDRNAQFERINQAVETRLSEGEPVISVDTKKKELIGPFKNNGQDWRPEGQPESVRVHDFVDPENGRASPYGVYDLGANAGWVNVGTDHDTASFAVQSIRRWWEVMGKPAYPRATTLLITADGGGSNGSRVRLWKLELQQLADETGLTITVRHFPPGTSKWNKIEHRLFSYISMNWRGRPLISHEVLIQLIVSTRTRGGLAVQAELDQGSYPKGIKVTDEEFSRIRLVRDEFHGEWNYSISPRAP